jgi:hypothetical protein
LFGRVAVAVTRRERSRPKTDCNNKRNRKSSHPSKLT